MDRIDRIELIARVLKGIVYLAERSRFIKMGTFYIDYVTAEQRIPEEKQA